MKEEEMYEPTRRFFHKRFRSMQFVEQPTLKSGKRADLAVRVRGGGLHIVEIEPDDVDIFGRDHGFKQLAFFRKNANYLWLTIPQELCVKTGPKAIMTECKNQGVGLITVSGGPYRYGTKIKKKPKRYHGYMEDFIKRYTNL